MWISYLLLQRISSGSVSIPPNTGEKADNGMSEVPNRSQSGGTELRTRFQMSDAPTFSRLEDPFFYLVLQNTQSQNYYEIPGTSPNNVLKKSLTSSLTHRH